MAPSVTYLGVKVVAQGLHIDKEPTEAEREAPQSTNQAELSHF